MEVQQVPGNLKEVGPKPLIMGQKEKTGTGATEYVTSVRSAPPGTCHSFTEAQRLASVPTEFIYSF